MSRQLQVAMNVLRWTVGFVVLAESLLFAFSHPAHHSPFPSWLPPALGGSEAVAAALFLLPATEAAGSGLLLVIFALAALIHFLHGQFNVGPLVVYAAAVIVCRASREREVAHE